MRLGAVARQHARGVVGADGRRHPPGRGTVGLAGQRRAVARPHCIMVNRRGERFTNEAANYNAFGAAFHVFDVRTLRATPTSRRACWTWSSTARATAGRYGLAGYTVAEPTPDGWYAGRLGRQARRRPRGVTASGSRDRGAVRRATPGPGTDRTSTVGRASTDRWWGDPSRKGAAATLGPLDLPPYLRGPRPERRAGHQGRAADGRQRARARRRRRARSPVFTRPATSWRRVGHDLRGPGRHARTGHGVRLPGRATCGGARRGPRRQLDRRGAGREVVDEDVDRQRRLAYMARCARAGGGAPVRRA